MTRKPIGPYSRANAMAHLDGRTRAARLAKKTRADLTAHVGGKPNAVQAVTIERVCQLTIRIGAMDDKFARTGEQTEHDSRTYLAWSNSLRLLLAELGAAAPPAPPRTLADHIAARAAE